LTKWRASYEQAEDNTRRGNDSRVVCGGAWINYQGEVRAAYRFGLKPDSRYGVWGYGSYVGFRVACAQPSSRQSGADAP
jgi:formylglycine-generating enzyme required for sulfatase activity